MSTSAAAMITATNSDCGEPRLEHLVRRRSNKRSRSGAKCVMGACKPFVQGRVTREYHPCGRATSIHKSKTFECGSRPQEAMAECTESTAMQLPTTNGTVGSGARPHRTIPTRRRTSRCADTARWAASAGDRSRLEMTCPTGIDLSPAEACLLTTRIRILLLPMVQATVRCACGADEPGTRNQPKMSSTHPVDRIDADPQGFALRTIDARVT